MEYLRVRTEQGNTVLVARKKKAEKKPKKKYVEIKRIVIFDDLAPAALPVRLRSVQDDPHYKALTIISSQWVTDIRPPPGAQIEYYMLFRHNTENLQCGSARQPRTD